jgi:hypothetical protein
VFKPRRARAGSNDKQIPMTKNPNNKPAQNLQSVFVLNFENWDLQIAWNL